MKLAPIVLFTYNDGGKNEKSWEKVNGVRKYLKTIKSQMLPEKVTLKEELIYKALQCLGKEKC
ncbi:MAG: hypothetical protein ACQERD_11260 [Campylobacterota bacterium]